MGSTNYMKAWLLCFKCIIRIVMTLYVKACGHSNTRVRVEQIIYAYDDSLISYVFWKTCTCNKPHNHALSEYNTLQRDGGFWMLNRPNETLGNTMFISSLIYFKRSYRTINSLIGACKRNRSVYVLILWKMSIQYICF